MTNKDERREIKEFALGTAAGMVNRRMWKLRQMVISLCDELDDRDEEREEFKRRERKHHEDLGMLKHEGFVLNREVEYSTGLTVSEKENGTRIVKVEQGEGDDRNNES